MQVVRKHNSTCKGREKGEGRGQSEEAYVAYWWTVWVAVVYIRAPAVSRGLLLSDLWPHWIVH